MRAEWKPVGLFFIVKWKYRLKVLELPFSQ
jgi:hypothetical protein